MVTEVGTADRPRGGGRGGLRKSRRRWWHSHGRHGDDCKPCCRVSVRAGGARPCSACRRGGKTARALKKRAEGGGARSLCWWRLGRRGQAGHGVGRDGRLRVGSAAPPPAGPPLTPSPPSTWYACRRPPAPPPTTRVNEPGRGSVGRTTGGPPCRRLAFRRRTTGLQPPPPALTPVLPPNAVGPCARALRHTCTKPARVTAGSTARWGGVRP